MHALRARRWQLLFFGSWLAARSFRSRFRVHVCTPYDFFF
jgi:hypothetical protein